MSRYCTHCSKVVEPGDGKRPDCGWPMDGDSGNRYYLTQPYQGGGFTVDLRPGEKLLERFTIESPLGRGSLGAVYLARDGLRSEKVALKVVPIGSESAADSLQQEMELNARVVEYSHVLRVHDVHAATYGGTALLVVSMEYADGGSLREWLCHHRDDLAQRQSEGLAFFKQACRGVQALHQAGIVHGDLKPENLLFRHGVLKVSDLSLSRCLHSLQVSRPRDAPPESPGLLGTPAYMSPEQLMAAHPDDVDLRSDIYALGILLFEICHPRCRPPFGGSYEQLRERHLHTPAPRLEDARPDVARVVARCLQKDPADRYESVLELLADLEGKLDVAAAGGPEDAGEQQRAEQVEGLWDRACQLIEAGDLTAAGRYCSQILRLVPEHEDARSMLEEIQGRSQKAQRFYNTIERGIGYQSLDELSALLREAVGVYPDHEEGHLVQVRLQSIAREYKQVMHGGVAAVGEGHWQEALSDLERARQLNPGFPAIVHWIDFVREAKQQIEETRAAIDTALSQRNHPQALSLARRLDEYVEQIKAFARRVLASEADHGTTP